MKPAATLGDMHVCPIYGHTPSPIVSGSGKLTVNGKPTACVGDSVGCGATIIEGTTVAMADGQLVAYLGSKTSHGGTIVSGDTSLMVDDAMASMVGKMDDNVPELTDELMEKLLKEDEERKALEMQETPEVKETPQEESDKLF